MIFEVCFEKTRGVPAKMGKVLQNVGFCPTKKYFKLASMLCHEIRFVKKLPCIEHSRKKIIFLVC